MLTTGCVILVNYLTSLFHVCKARSWGGAFSDTCSFHLRRKAPWAGAYQARDLGRARRKGTANQSSWTWFSESSAMPVSQGAFYKTTANLQSWRGIKKCISFLSFDFFFFILRQVLTL